MDKRIKRRDRRMMGRSPIAAFLDKQGIYLVMFVCLAIIGIAAYFTLGGNDEKAQTPSPSPAQEQQAGQVLTPSPDVQTPKPTLAAPAPTPTINPTPTEKAVAAVVQEPMLPISGDILRTFSPSDPVYFETLNAWMIHNGVDIKGELGAGVKAALDGKVKSVKNDPDTGYTIVLSHDKGIETVYGNLAAPEGIKVGQSIRQGEVIGAVGQSAQNVIADPSHVHFAYRVNGKYKDPIEQCQ